MKKILTVLVVLVLVAALGVTLFLLAARPAQRPPSTEKIEITPARVERGKYLAHHVLDCVGCHGRRDWTLYAAPLKGQPGVGGECLTKEQGAPGLLCSTNITPDPETGLGEWTDGEILRAIREGVGRRGNALFPLMPSDDYRFISDEDARSIVAYLRTMKPVRNAPPRTDLDFPVSYYVNKMPKPLDGPVPEPDRSDPVRYGEYLTEIAGCKFCHSTMDQNHGYLPGKLFAGDHKIRGQWGLAIGTNLTPHETGIGNLSKEQFIGIFRSFSDPSQAAPLNGGKNTPMPWYAYAGMTDEDLGAIYDYLRTLPPVASTPPG